MVNLWECCWKEFNNLPLVREKERTGRKILLVIVLFIWLSTTLLHYSLGIMSELFAIHIISAFFMIALALRWVLDLCSMDARIILAIGFITDMLLTFLFVGVTGGFTSLFLFLPLLYIFVIFIRHGLIQGISISILGTVGYSCLFLIEPRLDPKKYIPTVVLLLLTSGLGFFLCYASRCRERRLEEEFKSLQAALIEKKDHDGKCMPGNLKEIKKNLTDREWEVAFLAAKGFSNNDIAEKLAVAEVTVKKHLGAVFQKLDLTERRELTRLMFCERIGSSGIKVIQKTEET